MNIKDEIFNFTNGKTYKHIKEGKAYYDSENSEIMKRKKQYYTDKGLATDPYKANNKLASSFYKLIVKQLIGYLLGNGISIKSTTQPKDVDNIIAILGKKFNQKVIEWATNAAKCGVGWIHPYIDEKGQFNFDVIPPEQIVFKTDSRDCNKIKTLIRFYNLEYKGKKYTKAEEWTADTVTYWYKESENPFAKCKVDINANPDDPTCEIENPKAPLKKISKYGDRVESVTSLSWGRIPFIPMWGDTDKEYHLNPIKRHIDGYDIIQSDFMNNLEDIQDVYWILKGYEGEDLTTFLADVKRYKTIKVGGDGDARTETTQIPTEAREKMLLSLRKDIFLFGMAVDTDETGGGSITNVVIKSRYANLDLKADDFELQVTNSIQELIEFVNIYISITPQTNKPLLDFDLVFDRALIMNEVELMTMIDAQKGIVSEQTFLEHHPWTKDNAEEEKKRLEDDLETNPINIPVIPQVEVPVEK